MCAINGITGEDESLIRLMNEATKHRGPDGSSIHVSESITLGHNRLAVIDVSDASAQPMKSPDGRYVIVFNGEIYNYKELREELSSMHTFTTQGDTEVLLAAFSVWGMEMFPKLKGIFAFGIWDNKTQTLTLARDHMGVKPLYYAQQGNRLAFSSEIPALLKFKNNSRINTKSLSFYLAMEYVPSPETLVEDIQKLSPGQALVWRKGMLHVSSFLQESFDKRTVAHDELYSTIDRAVERQLVSDRPLGAYLSGGFDSSIVVHHMTEHASHVRTYSVDFEAVVGEEEGTQKFNEDARLAERTADFFGTKHKTFTIGIQDIRSVLEKAIESANEPIANSTAITQYLLSDFVRRDGTIVVLGGDGGDELFGGYTRHRIAIGAYLYQQLPVGIQNLGSLISPRAGKLRTPFGTALHRILMVKDEEKILPFLSSVLPINEATKAYFDTAYRQMPNEVHPVDAFMRVDRHSWLPDECFIRSDYASMAHGVELRVPFADVDVVQLSDEISIWKKTLPHQGKRIIQHVYKKHLPPHLYNQPKRGWLSPAAKWLRDPIIHTLAQEVFSSGYYDGLDGIFNWDATQLLLNDHLEKKGYYLYPLWNILVLQIWARKNGISV